MGSEAMRDTTMVEPLALNDQEMGLPLQDSLGPELMKLLDDLGGEDGWCEGGQAAVGAALDTAGLDRLDVFMDDAVGIPMPQDPQKAMELEQHKPRSNSCMLPPSAYRAPPLSEHYSGSYSELLPPQSAFQQIVMPSTPPTPVSRPATQKPRSIRRARSGLPAHLQSRSSSEPQEVLRRANSGSELQESQKQASKQVLSSSPKSTSTVFRPFSHLAAVEEAAAMAAKGRRIKRRGSERSEADELASVQEASPRAQVQPQGSDANEQLSQLLESQKRAYEAKLEDSGTRVSDLGRQLVRLQMEKQVLEQTLQQVLEQPLTAGSPSTSQQQDGVKTEEQKSSDKKEAAAKEVPKLFNPAEDYDAKSVLLVSLSDTPITLTAQQVTSMPWRQFVRLMKSYITQIGALLPEAEAQPKSGSAQRAEQLGREAMYIGSCLAAGIPRHTRTLYCLKLQESGPEHSRAPSQLWTSIMLQMNLNATQRKEVLRRRRAFLVAMAELLRRRRAITAVLQTLPHPDPSIAGLSNSYLRVGDMIERMQHNLEKDHSLVRRFTGGIVHQVWSPLQFARALVQSFPWMPDPLSIANCVAEQAQEPSAEEMLQNRTSSLASTSTASLASLFSNASQPSSPMLHNLSALMPWKQTGLHPNLAPKTGKPVTPGQQRPQAGSRSSGHLGQEAGLRKPDGQAANPTGVRPSASASQL